MYDTPIYIVTFIKNEEKMIREWILYHAHLFGISNLCVIDNNSIDATLDILREFTNPAIASQSKLRVIRGEKNFAKRDTYIQDIISQLNKELAIIGVYVENANISNISYATEIAAAMLQRQQAKKTGESRKEIVNAAVNTVVDAISQLEEKTNVKFSDEEKKEATVKLMLVICSDQQVTPTINIGQ